MNSKNFIACIQLISKKLPLFILLLTVTSFPVFSQIDYCAEDNCLFWEEQPEVIDSTLLIYASNQWSVDEWDNISCTFPVQQCENLRLEVYNPDLPIGEIRPLIVLIHGGAFIEGNRGDFRAYAQQLARLGYVTATIDYRLCKRVNCELFTILNLCGLNYWSDWGTSSYVATLDALTAIQYLQDNAESYHIDTENVIVGGGSAGAWTALQVAFMQQEDSDSLPGGVGRKNVWGALPTVAGIKGVFSLAGSMIDTSMISENENIPAFLVHGNCDVVLCYDFDGPYHCNANYPQMHGSANIATRMQHLNHDYYLYTITNGGHNVGQEIDGWENELKRFLKENVICQNPIQKHATADLNQDSDECLLLPHPLRPSADLMITDTFGIYPSPCEISIPVVEIEGDKAIRIFPNPSSDFLNIESQLKIEQLVVYSTSGVLIDSIKKDTLKGINLSRYQKGAYFIIFKLSDTVVYKKFIKL